MTVEQPGARIICYHLHRLGLAWEQLKDILAVTVTRVDKRVAVQVERVKVNLVQGHVRGNFLPRE